MGKLIIRFKAKFDQLQRCW